MEESSIISISNSGTAKSGISSSTNNVFKFNVDDREYENLATQKMHVEDIIDKGLLGFSITGEK